MMSDSQNNLPPVTSSHGEKSEEEATPYASLEKPSTAGGSLPAATLRKQSITATSRQQHHQSNLEPLPRRQTLERPDAQETLTVPADGRPPSGGVRRTSAVSLVAIDSRSKGASSQHAFISSTQSLALPKLPVSKSMDYLASTTSPMTSGSASDSTPSLPKRTTSQKRQPMPPSPSSEFHPSLEDTATVNLNMSPSSLTRHTLAALPDPPRSRTQTSPITVPQSKQGSANNSGHSTANSSAGNNTTEPSRAVKFTEDDDDGGDDRGDVTAATAPFSNNTTSNTSSGGAKPTADQADAAEYSTSLSSFAAASEEKDNKYQHLDGVDIYL